MKITHQGGQSLSCFIKDCTDISYASLHKSSEAILQGIQKGGLLASTAEIPIPTPMCKCHYHIVYNIIKPTQTHCIICEEFVEEAQTKAMLIVTIEVGKELLNDNAMRLPRIHEYM